MPARRAVERKVTKAPGHGTRPRLWPLLVLCLVFAASGAFFVYAGSQTGGGLIVAGVVMLGATLFMVGSLASSRRESGSGRLVRETAPRRVSTGGALLCGVMGVAFIALAVAWAPDGWRALRGEGVDGTFVPLDRKCSKSGCEWIGSFRSDDGTLQLRDVTFAGKLNSDGLATALAPHPDSREVYPPGGWTAFGWGVFMFVWGGLLLTVPASRLRQHSSEKQVLGPGCSYCRVERNRHQPANQIAAKPQSSDMLLLCPECGQLWDCAAFGRPGEPVSDAEAMRRFPGAWGLPDRLADN